MGFFKNMLSKAKKESEDSADKHIIELSDNCMKQAEQLADVVSCELEKGNYSGMNQQLSEIIPSSEEKERYVFEHPSIKSNILSIISSVIFIGLFSYVAFIGLASAVFSAQYTGYGVIIGLSSLALIAMNIVLIVKSVSTIQYKHRFDTYMKVLRFKNTEMLDNLSQFSKQRESRIIKDLEIGMKKKLIPQGHFTRGNLAFIVSDKSYNKYMVNCASYDRYFKKKIEEKARMKERSLEMKQIIETGNNYIQKIRDYNAMIKDKYVTEKLYRIESVVSMIFNEVDSNPQQAHSLGLFLNYYLPTTEKLLEAYITIGEKPITGRSLTKAQKDIEQSLETILKAYEGILERLYSEHEADIASDIVAMEIMMKQEGLTE